MKHLFIVNPVAGRTKPEDKIRLVHEALGRIPASERGEHEIYVTSAPMDAVGKIKAEAASGRALRVYALGGDGTLNECVNGAALLPNAAVTHFPCGTGNDFIRMFGDERGRFGDLAELIRGEVVPLDIIKCNDRYAVNICSMGLDARVGTDVHKYSRLPLIGGAGGYVVSLAANYIKGVKTAMTAHVEGMTCGPELNIVCVCNGRYYGGGFNPTNDARPDDGLMDVLIASGVGRAKLLGVIAGYATAKYKLYPQYITCVRTRRLEIDCRRPEVINIDGEAAHAQRAVFELIPGGVNFIAPRGLEFFRDKSL